MFHKLLSNLASLQHSVASVKTTSQIQEPVSWLKLWKWTSVFRS